MNWRNEPGDFLENLLHPAQDPQIPREVENQLRGRLAEFHERLAAREAGASGVPASRSRAARWAAAAVLSAAATIVFVLVWRLFPSGDAWASLLEAVKSKPWIHITGKTTVGKPIEVWYSFPRRVGGSRSDELVAFGDLRLGVNYLYRTDTKRIYRTRLEKSAGDGLDYLQTLFAAFARGDKKLALPENEVRLAKQQYRDVTEDGQHWRQYELTLEVRDAPSDPIVAVVRVDPQSGLPKSCRLVLPDDPQEILLAIDYPESGPADIYALGVPKTAEIVDHRVSPEADFEKIRDGLKAGRQRIEPYFGLIVESRAKEDWTQAQMMHRVWRAGNKWRIERVFFVDLKKFSQQVGSGEIARPGNDEDRFAWWKKTAERLRFEPLLVCDGKTAYRYNVRYSKSVIRLDEDVKDLSFEVESVRPDMRLDRDDPKPSLLVQPEFLGYPSVLSASPFMKSTVDADPKTGPPGTVLLTVAHEGPNSQSGPINRLWLDAQRGYLAVRWETQGKSDGEFMAHVIDDFGRSPAGHWYPAVWLRGSAKVPGGELRRIDVTRFHLDFKTPIAESVFTVPAKLTELAAAKHVKPLAAAQAAQRKRSDKNLRQLAMAMMRYHIAHRTFPAAYGLGPDGKTPHSWRVALLPLLGRKDLYDQYRFGEPWDSPANQEVLQSMPDVFRAGGDAKSTNACYYVLVGASTVFPGQQALKMADIRDGISNTLLIVEAKRDIPWTKPEDIPYDPQQPLPPLGGFDEAGFHAAMADSTVRFLENVDEPTLRALISRSGREIIRAFR